MTPVSTTDQGGAALRRCTALSAAQFAREHWGRHPLLTRAADLGDHGFADLLDRSAVDELLSRRGLRTPFLRMAKEGSVLPNKQFTRSGGSGAGIADQVADDKVLAHLAEGSTVVLQALHRTWPPLIDFGTRLAAELGHPVQINSYVTPAQNRGFAPHYDVHDVFVLQVSGRKHWRIHPPVVTDPLEHQGWERHRDAVGEAAHGEPLIDTVLEPGDALYLPRGTIHAAEALGELSIHLTVGVHPLTRYDVVRYVFDAAQSDDALRTSLPMDADLGDPAVLAPQLETTLDRLRAYLETVGADEIARRVHDKLAAQTRPEPIGPLAQLAAVDELDGATPLRLRESLRARVDADGDEVVLTWIDRTLRLPAGTSDAVKMIATGETFCAGELPGLDGDDQLVLARRLLRDGVVVVA